ncbi:MlaD family protein [Haloechinothrix salitolerans]|uniref:MlaD family protein n=1 Tax=Haloechinothrix salitolerans TaxID=926830 RepID=A0ABW2BYD5_9PSEU
MRIIGNAAKVVNGATASIASRIGWSQRAIGGFLILAAFFGVMFALYNKERISNIASRMFTDTATIEAEFPRAYKLRDHKSDVKVGGVIVGSTTDGRPSGDGTYIVTMQVDGSIRDKLGSEPSASIRPTLLLGGNYYVDLEPGGAGEYDGGRIPLARTSVPVELDRVLDAVGGDEAKAGIRASIRQMDRVLENGGSRSIRGLVKNAPATLDPATDVLLGVRGTRPNRDLTDLVSGMHATGKVLTARSGQLQEIITSLRASTRSLRAGSRPLAESVGTLPETLRVTRAGLADLRPTLRKLTDTASEFRPVATELDEMLAKLEPVLRPTLGLLKDLKPTLEQAKPLVRRLVPATSKATGVASDVKGPVLNRVEGPISDTVLSPWSGQGRYAGGGASGNRMYVELGYLFSRGADALSWNDGSGGHSRLAAGIAPNSISGLGQPLTMRRYLELVGALPPGSARQNDQRSGK